MDRAAIQELFVFSDYCWRQHEETIRALGDDVLTKPVNGSGWPALRDALAHVNFGYDRWLSILTGRPMTGFDVESVRSWDDLESYRRRERARFRESLDSFSDGELATERPMSIDGETLLYSPADILVHALLHERGHDGDISTLLYQLGVEPPVVEYRFSLPVTPS